MQKERDTYHDTECGHMNTKEIITKTAVQYSEPLPKETMEFLRGIAQDYCKVKNYVRGQAYAGIQHTE